MAPSGEEMVVVSTGPVWPAGLLGASGNRTSTGPDCPVASLPVGVVGLTRRRFRLCPGGQPASMEPSSPTTNIGDYAFLSDCQSAVLIDRHGSIDWWCAPRFDSASIFARLLGAEGGHWAIRPTTQFSSEREYIGESLVLRTVHELRSGSVAVTDAAALEVGARGHEIGRRSPHVLIRRVECLTGTAELEIDFAPRMEYGLTIPIVSAIEGGVAARGGPVELRLTGPVPLTTELGRAWATFILSAGESVVKASPPALRTRSRPGNPGEMRMRAIAVSARPMWPAAPWCSKA
jgi:hypothetical protein